MTTILYPNTYFFAYWPMNPKQNLFQESQSVNLLRLLKKKDSLYPCILHFIWPYFYYLPFKCTFVLPISILLSCVRHSIFSIFTLTGSNSFLKHLSPFIQRNIHTLTLLFQSKLVWKLASMYFGSICQESLIFIL